MSGATETLSALPELDNSSAGVDSPQPEEDTKPLQDSPKQVEDAEDSPEEDVMNDIFGEDSDDHEDSQEEENENEAEDNFAVDEDADDSEDERLLTGKSRKKSTKKTTKKKSDKEDEEEKPKTKRKPRAKAEKKDGEGKKKRKAPREPKEPAPKKRKSGRSDEEKLAIVQDTITRMQEAREQDLKAFEAHKPSLQKIQLLKQIENTLVNRSLEQTLMENKILNEIALWMKPMPDRSLPNIAIREFALKFLGTISYRFISPDELKSSEVGKFVRLYSKSKKETDINKEAATRIAERMVAFLKAESRFGVGSAY